MSFAHPTGGRSYRIATWTILTGTTYSGSILGWLGCTSTKSRIRLYITISSMQMNKAVLNTLSCACSEYSQRSTRLRFMPSKSSFQRRLHASVLRDAPSCGSLAFERRSTGGPLCQIMCEKPSRSLKWVTAQRENAVQRKTFCQPLKDRYIHWLCFANIRNLSWTSQRAA